MIMSFFFFSSNLSTKFASHSLNLITRACNFRYIAIQWEKPTTYGDALITGYKVYVNGIVEAVLSADSLSYTFTQGKWCQEYSFQVQVTPRAQRRKGGEREA